MRRTRTLIACTLLALIASHLPLVGSCHAAEGLFKRLLGSQVQHENDVAIKIAELPEHYREVTPPALDFSPDGKLLAVRSADQTINIWDWQAGRIVRTVEIAKGGVDGSTEPLRFSPDGRLLVACHNRGEGDVVARIWKTDTWGILYDIVDHVPGGCNAIGFTPDGKLLIRVLDRFPEISGDTLVIYDVGTWQPIWGMRTVPFYTYALAISPDAKFIAIGGEVINPQYGTSRPSFGNPPSPDTALIAIVDMAQRAIVRTIQYSGVMDRVSRIVWSPNGNWLVGAGGEGLQIVDVQWGRPILEVKPPLGTAHTSLRYTPDGKYLIEGVFHDKGRGWGKIWDSQHAALLQEISGAVGSIAVSRDGRYLATGGYGKTVIWQFK